MIQQIRSRIMGFWKWWAGCVYYDFSLVREDRGAPEFVLKEGKEWPGTPTSNAFENYGCIFWPNRSTMSNSYVLRHELSHVEDRRRFGHLLTTYLYNRYQRIHGYRDNPLEIKARKAAADSWFPNQR
jgi:hypothetical protein